MAEDVALKTHMDFNDEGKITGTCTVLLAPAEPESVEGEVVKAKPRNPRSIEVSGVESAIGKKVDIDTGALIDDPAAIEGAPEPAPDSQPEIAKE